VHLCQTLFRGLADDMDVIDWLRERVWPLEQAHDEASLGASAALGIAELLTGGTTTVLSMESVRHTDASFAAAERLGIRAFIGKALMDRWEPGTEMVGEDTDDAWADVIGQLGRWHGSAGGRIRVALSPRGPRNATPELWRRCVGLAEDADLVLHTHVNENQGQARRLGATAEGRDLVALDSWGALSRRLVMAHSVWLDDEERALLRQHRPNVCHCPSANLKLASGIAPIPEYLADGINVALGADGAACNNRLDVFTEMRLAALVHKPRCGPRAMPATTVLELATMGGARALGLADQIGSIEVGKRADLTVVRVDRSHVAPLAGSDPADQLVYACQPSDVTTVVVDGAVVVRDGHLCSGDETAIGHDAEVQRVALLARAGLR
jgi:cytosine/adenosine deaminase-related metal-dependent hydrolase